MAFSYIIELMSRIETVGNVDKANVARVEKIVNSLDKLWTKVLEEQTPATRYDPARYVLFEGKVNTACGQGLTQFGPFYCGPDRTIYLDQNWFTTLTDEFGVKDSELAEIYVIAHETGHHVQNCQGTFHRSQYPGGDGSVRVRAELQADAYAGIWLQSAVKERGFKTKLQGSKLDSLIDIAEAVGDDNLQKIRRGEVDARRFGHGYGEQRKQFLLLGYETGSLAACDIWDMDLQPYESSAILDEVEVEG